MVKLPEKSPSHTLLLLLLLLLQEGVCVPYETTKQRLLVISSLIAEVETIQKCQSASSSCQRLPRMVTFYKGTVYETTVDVGMCSGVCIENNACLATKKKTKAISSPNGMLHSRDDVSMETMTFCVNGSNVQP